MQNQKASYKDTCRAFPSEVGIDTLSPDNPKNDFPVHKLILEAGKYIIENVANTNLLPTNGSIICALPIKIKEGTEAPIRLVAMIPI